MLAGALPWAMLQKGQVLFIFVFSSDGTTLVQMGIWMFSSKSLKNKLWFMLVGAEVAQFGRALDSTTTVVEGEAEDRVVAGSSPALGTTKLF